MHLLSVEDGIAVVTLNRPEALNSINKAMRLELLELFPALDLRKDVKVIVITGAGDKAFCTGADLKERSTRTTEEMVYDRHYLTSNPVECQQAGDRRHQRLLHGGRLRDGAPV
jgi:enoyl-CoA hydratase/carnithine racemase